MPLENLLQGKYENLTILLQRYLALDKTCSHCLDIASLLLEAGIRLSLHHEAVHGNVSTADKLLHGSLVCDTELPKVLSERYANTAYPIWHSMRTLPP